jgi:flagellar hook assembly protein FlgD
VTDQTIQFSLPQPLSNVRLEVVDATGRTVWSHVLRDLVAGSHAVGWDGRDRHGRTVAPSVYFVRMSSEAGAASGSLIRVR